jgi:hypothetical protein
MLLVWSGCGAVVVRRGTKHTLAMNGGDWNGGGEAGGQPNVFLAETVPSWVTVSVEGRQGVHAHIIVFNNSIKYFLQHPRDQTATKRTARLAMIWAAVQGGWLQDEARSAFDAVTVCRPSVMLLSVCLEGVVGISLPDSAPMFPATTPNNYSISCRGQALLASSVSTR